MRALFVSSLFVFLGITLIASKPLEESINREIFRPLNKTEIAKMIADSKLLEKLAKDTYFAKVLTSEETYKTKDATDQEKYLSKDPTDEEVKDPTEEETKDPTDEETYLSKDPTGEPTKDEFFIEEDDEEEDEATVDKPTDAQPVNFLKYPAIEENFKPYPRFAILRNGYVHHMNLDF